jgi:large subunit ribosomal protein L5
MHFLEYYYNTVIKYDLINKFKYKNTKYLPKLNKIVLNFGCKKFDIKNLSIALLALELISLKKGTLAQAKRPNILLKIKKGNPVGCKVILKKHFMYNFLAKLLIDVFPKLKNFTTLKIAKNKLRNHTFSYRLKDNLIFLELEQNYYIFNNLPDLNITLVADVKNEKEFIFLLNSFKLPIHIFS